MSELDINPYKNPFTNEYMPFSIQGANIIKISNNKELIHFSNLFFSL